MKEEIFDLLKISEELESEGRVAEADEAIAIAEALALGGNRTAQVHTTEHTNNGVTSTSTAVSPWGQLGQPLMNPLTGALNQPNTLGVNPQMPQPQVQQDDQAAAKQEDIKHRRDLFTRLNNDWTQVMSSGHPQAQAIGGLLQQALNILWAGGTVQASNDNRLTKTAQGMGTPPGAQPAAETTPTTGQPAQPAAGAAPPAGQLDKLLINWVAYFRGDQSLDQGLRNQLVGIMSRALQVAQGQAVQSQSGGQQAHPGAQSPQTGDREFDLWVQFAKKVGRDEAIKNLRMDRVGFLNSGVPFVLKPKDDGYIANVLRAAGGAQ